MGWLSAHPAGGCTCATPTPILRRHSQRGVRPRGGSWCGPRKGVDGRAGRVLVRLVAAGGGPAAGEHREHVREPRRLPRAHQHRVCGGKEGPATRLLRPRACAPQAHQHARI